MHLAQAAPHGSKTTVLKLGGCEFEEPAEQQATLWQALEQRDHQTALTLLSNGASVNLRGGPYGCTPLGWAALNGQLSLASSLLEMRADPLLPAERGSFPLHMATWNDDHVEMVELLLRAGARVSVRNSAGKTALDVAKQMDEVEALSTIESTYGLDEWRKRCGRPPAGRSRVIVALTAAASSSLPEARAPKEPVDARAAAAEAAPAAAELESAADDGEDDEAMLAAADAPDEVIEHEGGAADAGGAAADGEGAAEEVESAGKGHSEDGPEAEAQAQAMEEAAAFAAMEDDMEDDGGDDDDSVAVADDDDADVLNLDDDE